MKASAMDDAPDARDCAARRNGYSVVHLGPGGATEQEMLETWLLLEVQSPLHLPYFGTPSPTDCATEDLCDLHQRTRCINCIPTSI